MTARSRLWVGADEPYLDAFHVEVCGAVAMGMFGGMTQAGAVANEDAAVVLSVPEPFGTFAALFDAHGGSDSAQLGVRALKGRLDDVRAHLSQSVPEFFRGLGRLATETFSQGEFVIRVGTI